MKNPYTALTAAALLLLVSTGASAQSTRTLSQMRQAEQFAAKKHSAQSHHHTAVSMRGGGVANDECGGAILIDVGTECVGTAGSYDGATQTFPPSVCNTYQADTTVDVSDVWYSFVAAGDVTIVQVTGGGDDVTGADAILEVYSGDCADLTSMGCADATVRAGTEQMAITTVPGTTYYYRTYFWTYSDAQTVFDFTTCVYTPQNVPANDQCSGAVAQALAAGSSVNFTGDNTGALDTEGLGTASVWESFTTTECTMITLDYCGTDPVFGNAFLSLFIGCPTTSFFPNATVDTSCPDGNVTITYEYVPAGTYYYAVLTEDGSVGPYTINVSAVACAPGYCTGSGTTCDEYLANVQIGTINNTSECSDGTLADYTSQSTAIAPGASLAITVLNGPNVYPEDQVAVWVDWDNDESFYGANEQYALASADEGVTFTGSVDAPVDATPGPVRMRVRMMYTGTPLPCGTSDYGEVEDYTLTVDAGSGVATNDVGTFNIFPNPTDGDLVVSAARSMNALAEVLDVTGRRLHASRISGTQATLNLAGELANGTYVLRLTDANGTSERRFVVR